MARAIDVVQVKAEIAAEKLAVIIENGSVLLKDMQSGEAVKIATLTTPNEPLTLEELREMNKPVWVACKPIEGGDGDWCLCKHGCIVTPSGNSYDVGEIPHWVFYRRPPEGAEDGNV